MKECVVVLHGLGRTSMSMFRITNHLRRQGYLVYCKSYPSRDNPIEQLAEQAIAPAVRWCQMQGATKIHFVTHSLGGILFRYYLQDHQIDNLGRVVMLSPPNKGSEVTELLFDLPLYRLFSGPVGLQLRTTPDSLPNQMAPIAGDIGVIAGARSSDPWFSMFIDEQSDGKVTIDNTKLTEMSDFLIVKHGHTYIMNSLNVIEQIHHFLINGKFDQDKPIGRRK